jgi:hypothetical protein
LGCRNALEDNLAAISGPILNTPARLGAPPPVRGHAVRGHVAGTAGAVQAAADRSTGAGSLTDADLTKETARLRELHSRLLGPGAPLSILSRTPKTLLSLFADS